ncbi:hypothetical protein AB0D09_11430 [Streptomyces sp. NPDC049097]|uniref:hypothetical protein n=1 Tax=unclassified Streptomyces TaxID=2593676 RepID=UPI003406CA15
METTTSEQHHLSGLPGEDWTWAFGISTGTPRNGPRFRPRRLVVREDGDHAQHRDLAGRYVSKTAHLSPD